MPSLDQRVCHCKHHSDGDEDCGSCCNYVAQCERDELQVELAECAKLVLWAASWWPTHDDSWTGTISQRLRALLTREHNARLRAEGKDA